MRARAVGCILVFMKRMSSWDSLEFFSRAEFSAADEMSFELLVRLDMARRLSGVPFRITSSFRAGDPGAHGQGEAVDIACSSSGERYAMVRSLLAVGFSRIGVYRRHVHADVSKSRAQSVLWYGEYSDLEVRCEASSDVKEEFSEGLP